MRATLPHRLAAVWFADIVGYGRLSSRNENEALHLVQLFQRACRDVVRERGGRIVKFMGDGALAEFASTEAAVRAACGLETAFRREAASSGLEAPALHVGVHVGEIATAPDGDLYGEGLNLASRLMTLAGPGEVFASEDVHRQLHHRPEFAFEALGDRPIKDSDEPVPVFCVVGSPGADASLESEARESPWRALHREMVRRQVYGVAVAYLVIASVVVATAALLIGRLGGPEWAVRALALVAVLGLPVAVLLAWTFEVGREGLRRYGPAFGEPGAGARPRLAYVALVLIVAGFAGAISVVRPPPTGDLPALPANRVAVLYFDDISPGRGLGYLVDGLTEALIHELSGVRGLEVVSRNGVKRFQDVSVPVDSVARALNAGTLVQGSVSESEGQLRVTVQLIDGATGTVVAGATVGRPRGELFALQDELAEQVSNFLRSWLGEEIRLAEMRAGTRSVAAWELVQRAEQHREEAQSLVQSGSLEEAGRLYDRADSLLALALAADSTWNQPPLLKGWLAHERSRWYETSAIDRFVRWNETGLRQAEAALRMNPGDPDALELRGTLRLRRALITPARDPTEAEAQLELAEEDLRAAIESNPEQAGAWSMLSVASAAQGKPEEAKLAASRAYEADAYLREADEIIWRLFAMSFDLNQAEEAGRWCQVGALRFPDDPDFVRCGIWQMTMPGAPAAPERAWALLVAYDSLVPPHAVRARKTARMAIAAVLAGAGLRDSALAVAERARGDAEIDPARELEYYEAFVRTLAGREAEAVDLLERYLRASPGQRQEVAITWWFDGLHDRADFQALIAGTDTTRTR